MEKENIIQQKSFDFAVSIINTFKVIQKERHEYILTKQILRSGTSIGANIEEAIGAYTQKDFLYKINISYKEARETKYWIKLMLKTELINIESASQLIEELDSILRILAKIQKTLREKLNIPYK